jgi:hypothetical protein
LNGLYSDYANWQRNWLQGEILETQINYWKNQLSNAPLLLELPTDYPRPALQSYRGDRYSSHKEMQTLTDSSINTIRSKASLEKSYYYQ